MNWRSGDGAGQRADEHVGVLLAARASALEERALGRRGGLIAAQRAVKVVTFGRAATVAGPGDKPRSASASGRMPPSPSATGIGQQFPRRGRRG